MARRLLHRGKRPASGANAMRLSLVSTLLLLVPGLAHAEGLERSVPVASAGAEGVAQRETIPDRPRDPAEPRYAQLPHALDARVLDVLDRSADRAAEQAMALLEAREAELLGEMTRITSDRVEQQLASALVRGACGGALQEDPALRPGARAAAPRLARATEPSMP